MVRAAGGPAKPLRGLLRDAVRTTQCFGRKGRQDGADDRGDVSGAGHDDLGSITGWHGQVCADKQVALVLADRERATVPGRSWLELRPLE